MPELPDLNSPPFAPIKSRLARAYLDHKATSARPTPPTKTSSTTSTISPRSC
ncbi:MAG TPA: hypothetical protein VK635_19115 [Bradyrhizobium sp.]|jgi:hypothetical protein|nr:hypothetical protein [Bradyrhizobium sp.]